MEARGGDSVSSRAVVPGRRKAALLVSAVGAAFAPAGRARGATVPDGDLLVRAAAWAPAVSSARGFERLFDILSDLERRPPAGRHRLEPSR